MVSPTKADSNTMKVLFALEMPPLKNSVKGRVEHIFEKLSNNYKIIIFSKMENILSIIKNHPKHVLEHLKLKIVVQNVNLYRVELPAIFLPAANIYRIINKINNIILGLFVRLIKRKLNIEKVNVWWIGYPFAVDYVQGKSNIVYDCFDEHLGWEGFYLKKTVKYIERDLLDLADISIFSASKLQINKGKYSKNANLILNGTDFDHFYIDQARSLVNSKIVLYSGVISHWFDVDLVDHCVSKLNDFIFWFVGPDRRGYLSHLKEKSNVKHFGLIDYKDLPKYYAEANVCIIPFKINELIDSTNPIKLYEYLSAGKPVVTTNFSEAKKYKDCIYIANDKYEFLESIKTACIENSSDKVIQRQGVAFVNSWDHRVNEIKNIMNTLKY